MLKPVFFVVLTIYTSCKAFQIMNRFLKFLLINATGIVFFASCEKDDENKTYLHEIRFTASSIELEKWNISDTTNIAFVKEFVDDKGRTKELRFYNYNHKLDWAGSGFWGGPIIRYDYTDNQIIETFFSSDNEIANDFKTSEVPYKHIYSLNNENQIIQTKQIYKIDFEWTEESFEETSKHLDFYKDYVDKSSGSGLEAVFGYGFAYAKMNGINPQTKK